jgi:hypothetical protein
MASMRFLNHKKKANEEENLSQNSQSTKDNNEIVSAASVLKKVSHLYDTEDKDGFVMKTYKIPLRKVDAPMTTIMIPSLKDVSIEKKYDVSGASNLQECVSMYIKEEYKEHVTGNVGGLKLTPEQVQAAAYQYCRKKGFS